MNECSPMCVIMLLMDHLCYNGNMCICNLLLMCVVNMLAVSYNVIVLCHMSTVMTASLGVHTTGENDFISLTVMSVCMIILVMRAFIYEEMLLFILNLYVFMSANIVFMDIKLHKRGSRNSSCLHKPLSVMFNRTIT